MYIYINYYKQICKKPSQIKLLDKIERYSKTIETKNKSGETIIKHYVGFWDFNKLNIGVTYKIEKEEQ